MIVVDVETTGLDPKRHSIVSIGALDFFNPQNQFYEECRIWEGAEVAQEALQINGFSEEEIKNPERKTVEEAIKDFLKWVGDIKEKILAGQNTSFDRDFLNSSIKRYCINYSFGKRIIDLHTVCYANYLSKGFTAPYKEGQSALNLDNILIYVGLPAEPKPHNALLGAKMEAEALSRLIYGKILLKEFNAYPLPSHLVKN